MLCLSLSAASKEICTFFRGRKKLKTCEYAPGPTPVKSDSVYVTMTVMASLYIVTNKNTLLIELKHTHTHRGCE